jgi:hypothetical protein
VVVPHAGTCAGAAHKGGPYRDPARQAGLPHGQRPAATAQSLVSPGNRPRSAVAAATYPRLIASGYHDLQVGTSERNA